jgi:hypothetical protein
MKGTEDLHEVKLNAYKDIAKRKGLVGNDEILLGLFMSLTRIGIRININKPKHITDKVIMSFSNMFDMDGKFDAITASRMASVVMYSFSGNVKDVEKKIIIRYIMWDTSLSYKEVDESFNMTNREFFPVFSKALFGHDIIVVSSVAAGKIIKESIETKQLTLLTVKDMYEKLILRSLFTEHVVLYTL